MNDKNTGKNIGKENNKEATEDIQAVAEKIRAAYLETALTSYEDAAANGLCAEGAWEVAVDSMRRLEITDLLQSLSQPTAASSDR